jgi:hypothetical protein
MKATARVPGVKRQASFSSMSVRTCRAVTSPRRTSGVSRTPVAAYSPARTLTWSTSASMGARTVKAPGPGARPRGRTGPIRQATPRRVHLGPGQELGVFALFHIVPAHGPVVGDVADQGVLRGVILVRGPGLLHGGPGRGQLGLLHGQLGPGLAVVHEKQRIAGLDRSPDRDQRPARTLPGHRGADLDDRGSAAPTLRRRRCRSRRAGRPRAGGWAGWGWRRYPPPRPGPARPGRRS